MKRLLTTKSGTSYIVDDTEMTLERFPQGEAQEMRKDGEVIPMISLLPITLGEPLICTMIGLSGSGVTFRRTSPVTRIEEL